MNQTENDLLSDWARLGILWNVPLSSRVPDVENLIIDSLSFIRGNPRLLVLVTTWLSVYSQLVDRERLLALASAASPFEQATLGLVLETANQWINSSALAVIACQLRPLTPARPLFDADRRRPALARLAELETSAIARHWGLWCMPIMRKLNAIRPEGWVMGANPSLAQRAALQRSGVTMTPVAARTRAE